jgi:hypothetical protein
MVIEVASGDDARKRLRHSRAEIYELVRELQGHRPPPGPDFPRSRLMRSLIGQRGPSWVAGAGLALTLMRPRMIWRLARWALTHPLTHRIVIPWLARRAGIVRRA